MTLGKFPVKILHQIVFKKNTKKQIKIKKRTRRNEIKLMFWIVLQSSYLAPKYLLNILIKLNFNFVIQHNLFFFYFLLLHTTQFNLNNFKALNYFLRNVFI